MNVLNNYLVRKDTLLTLSFSIALILSSQITIPFYPVPFTLQTLMLAIAVFYDSRIAMKSMLIYMVLGIIGLPIFAEWSNAISAFNSPSFGYIIGMLLATSIIYFVNARSIISKIAILNITTFGCGIIPLTYLFGLHTALYSGLLVFIAPEILKTVIAVLIYRYIK